MAKEKIIEYKFERNKLRFWNKETGKEYKEIDLDEFIDWKKVHNKGLEKMKRTFPKETKFVNIGK